jgi:hypothetical protein
MYHSLSGVHAGATMMHHSDSATVIWLLVAAVIVVTVLGLALWLNRFCEHGRGRKNN